MLEEAEGGKQRLQLLRGMEVVA